VVDDTQDAAEALAVILELQGYEVAVAFGGQQALRMLETFRPQIAVLDLAMPGMDGYALARQVRETQWGAAIHFIAFTGWSDERSRTRAISAGFHQYLVKPVDPRRFIRMIAEVEVVA
jgi:DNA-binding response OmpR family regulator